MTFYLYACDGCHDLMKISMVFKGVPIATVKEIFAYVLVEIHNF